MSQVAHRPRSGEIREGQSNQVSCIRSAEVQIAQPQAPFHSALFTILLLPLMKDNHICAKARAEVLSGCCYSANFASCHEPVHAF